MRTVQKYTGNQFIYFPLPSILQSVENDRACELEMRLAKFLAVRYIPVTETHT